MIPRRSSSHVAHSSPGSVTQRSSRGTATRGTRVNPSKHPQCANSAHPPTLSQTPAAGRRVIATIIPFMSSDNAGSGPPSSAAGK